MPINILIVDDHSANRSSLEAILESPDYNIVLASSGEEALRCLLKQEFAMILMDFNMPLLNGIQTAKLIQGRPKQPPILFITASQPSSDLVTEAYSAGGSDFIIKPIDTEILRSKVMVFADLYLTKKELAGALEAQEVARKNAEVRLGLTETKYRTLIEQLPTITYVAEVGPTGKWFYVSPQIEGLLGYTPREWLLTPSAWMNHIHEEDRQRVLLTEEESSKTHQPFVCEYRMTTKDNQVVWIRDEATWLAGESGVESIPLLQGVLLNITDQMVASRTLDESREELRQKTADFRMLFAGNPLPMWVFHRTTYQFLEVNETAVGLYGYSREEFLNMNIFDIRPKDDHERLFDHLNGQAINEELIDPFGQSGRERDLIWRHHKKNGTILFVEIDVHNLEWESEPARLVVVRDVTDREKTRHAMRLQFNANKLLACASYEKSISSKMLRLICAELECQAGFLWWPDRDGKTLHMLDYSYLPDLEALPLISASRDFLVRRGEGAHGMAWQLSQYACLTDLGMYRYDRRFSLASQLGLRTVYLFPAIADEKSVGIIELMSRSPQNADSQLLEVSQQVAHQLGQYLERRKLEEGSRKNEQRLRALIEHMPGMLYTSDRALRVTSCEGTFMHELFADRDQIVGASLPELFQTSESAIVHSHQLALDGTAGFCEMNSGGKSFECNVQALYNSRNQIEGTIAILTDVTAKRQSEERQKQQEEQIRQSQKIEAIGQLAGGVAHDFNNILLAILAYCELSDMHLANDDDAVRRDIREIRLAADKAASLTRQLLAFSRKQVLEPVFLNVNEIISGLQTFLRRLIPENVQVTLDLDNSLGQINADPTQIEQIVLNLSINARDAMPDGGTIIVTTRNLFLDENYASTHFDCSPGEYIELGVQDTGTGIEESLLKHIFEPFFTTKEEGKGTGLGLSTVYGIVKQSGGTIWVYSEVGKGTSFKIYFPRVNHEAVHVARKESSDSMARSKGETILLVDDNEQIRASLGPVLEFHGYVVLYASTGEEAITVSQNHVGNIDVLMSDMIMPGMTGMELSHQLSLQRRNMKVLFMSGYSEDAVKKINAIQGEAAFLQKPASVRSILMKIRDLLNEAESSRANKAHLN